MTDVLIDDFKSDDDSLLLFRDVRKRWAHYRIHFMKYVGGSGGILMLLCLIMVHRSEPVVSFILVGGAAYFVMGNVCFSLGYLAEAFSKVTTNQYLSQEAAHRLYQIGFWFSMILTCGLGILALMIVTNF